MIEQNVQLVRCEGERIWVRMGSQSGCTACDNGHGCGAGLFAKLLRQKPVIIELMQKDLDAEPGQMVTLAFPEHVYIKLVLASYGWPLLAALAGAFAGHGLGVWLKLTSATIDVVTLVCGLLAAVIVMRGIKSRTNPGAVIKSMRMTVCNSSATPNICNGSQTDPS